MKASGFSDAQRAFIIKQGEEGTPVAEICRRAGISQATYFNWLPGCCRTNANQSLQGRCRRPLCRTEAAPLGESGGAVGLEILSAVETALKVEMVVDRGVDGGVDGGEFLQGSHLAKPLHGPFSPSEWLVGVLTSLRAAAISARLSPPRASWRRAKSAIRAGSPVKTVTPCGTSSAPIPGASPSPRSSRVSWPAQQHNRPARSSGGYFQHRRQRQPLGADACQIDAARLGPEIPGIAAGAGEMP